MKKKVHYESRSSNPVCKRATEVAVAPPDEEIVVRPRYGAPEGVCRDCFETAWWRASQRKIKARQEMHLRALAQEIVDKLDAVGEIGWERDAKVDIVAVMIEEANIR